MKINSILVLGGTHGNEQLGIEIVKLLKKDPIKNVQAVIANPRAVKVNDRFTESDLNRSFGTQFPNTYETRRALKLRDLARKFDLVLDFHNTQTPKNNSTFVGIGCDFTLFNVAKVLRINRCVEATYDCINKYCLNTMSIEISVNDKLDDAKYWYKQIQNILKMPEVPSSMLTIYQFKQRVTWDQKNKFNFSNWLPFKEISISDKNKLGLSGIIVPIFIGSKLTEHFATLLSKEREE